MAISSSTTDQQLWDEYDDTCTYEEQASTSLAARFISACVMLMRRQPTRMSTNGYSVDFPGDRIQDELNYARTWNRMNQSTGGAVKYADFRNLRV